jgi:hypothetical protein
MTLLEYGCCERSFRVMTCKAYETRTTSLERVMMFVFQNVRICMRTVYSIRDGGAGLPQRAPVAYRERGNRCQ